MKTLNIFIVGMVLLSFAACKNRNFDQTFFKGYSRTDSGLYYKFHIHGDKEKTALNDRLFCVMKMYWCDERIIQLGVPDSIIHELKSPRFLGDLSEGLLMMRVGDSASFIIPADSVLKHWGNAYHKGFEHHLCEYLRITVRLDSLQPFDSAMYLHQIQIDSIVRSDFETQIFKEHQQLRNFVRGRNISVEPNSDGVYVVVLRKGTGVPVTKGKIAVFDYTGRMLDGRIWDSSDEEISYHAGIAFPQRHYKPQEIRIGENQWMLALDNALVGQTVGSKLRLFMPSGAVFGHEGTYFAAKFQPVILEIDLLDVK